MDDKIGGDDRLQESLLEGYRALSALECADPQPLRLISPTASREPRTPPRLPSINSVNWKAVISVGSGIAGLVAALLPVLFVAAGLAGLCAMVIGLLAYRRATDTTAIKGKGLSIMGTLLGMLSLALAIGGYAYVETNNDSAPHPLKDMAARADPADYALEQISCAVAGGQAEMSGTVTNHSDRTRGFTIQGGVTDPEKDRELIGYATVLVLASGRTAAWSLNIGPVGEEVDCEVLEVFYFA